MCMHDAEHDFQNLAFKAMDKSNMNLNFFRSSNFLLVGGRLVGGRCIQSVVGWSAGRGSVVGGRLVGGFKETLWGEYVSKKLKCRTNWKLTEKSTLVRLIDYFRVLKALIILFLLYICMNYVPKQNRKVQEETLAYSNLDAVKTTLRL